jgi:hypothetical protein
LENFPKEVSHLLSAVELGLDHETPIPDFVPLDNVYSPPEVGNLSKSNILLGMLIGTANI